MLKGTLKIQPDGGGEIVVLKDVELRISPDRVDAVGETEKGKHETGYAKFLYYYKVMTGFTDTLIFDGLAPITSVHTTFVAQRWLFEIK